MKLTLPIQRPMIHGESPQGYALRLAEINLYGSAHWVSSLMDVDTTSASGLVSMGKALKKLAELSGAKYSQLKSASYQRHKASPHVISAFGGQLFSRSLLDFKNAKVCPRCLKESQHARQVWDLSMATVCPHHQVRLVHRCPETGKHLTWGRPSISFSSDEGDLANVEAIPVRTQDAVLAELLHKSARIQVSKCAGDHFIPKEIKAMSLAQFHELICFVGWAAGMMREPSARAVPILSHSRRAEVMALVADVLFDWPGRWFEIIEQRRVSENAVGFQKIFGGFYQRLYEKGKGSPLAILQDGFKQYCEKYEVGSVVSARGNPTLILSGEKSGYVSAEKARKDLKVGKDIFSWLISIGKLQVTTNDLGGQVAHRVQTGSISVAREYYDSLIGTDQVRQTLGISKPLAIKMLEQGFVKAVRGPTVDKYRNWVVERDAADDFVRDVVSRASTISDDVVSVSSAIAWLRSEGIPAIQIIASIMDGRLEYHLDGDAFTSLNDLQVDKDQLISWTDELLIKGELAA